MDQLQVVSDFDVIGEPLVYSLVYSDLEQSYSSLQVHDSI